MAFRFFSLDFWKGTESPTQGDVHEARKNAPRKGVPKQDTEETQLRDPRKRHRRTPPPRTASSRLPPPRAPELTLEQDLHALRNELAQLRATRSGIVPERLQREAFRDPLEVRIKRAKVELHALESLPRVKRGLPGDLRMPAKDAILERLAMVSKLLETNARPEQAEGYQRHLQHLITHAARRGFLKGEKLPANLPAPLREVAKACLPQRRDDPPTTSGKTRSARPNRTLLGDYEDRGNTSHSGSESSQVTEFEGSEVTVLEDSKPRSEHKRQELIRRVLESTHAIKPLASELRKALQRAAELGELSADSLESYSGEFDRLEDLEQSGSHSLRESVAQALGQHEGSHSLPPCAERDVLTKRLAKLAEHRGDARDALRALKTLPLEGNRLAAALRLRFPEVMKTIPTRADSAPSRGEVGSLVRSLALRGDITQEMAARILSQAHAGEVDVAALAQQHPSIAGRFSRAFGLPPSSRQIQRALEVLAEQPSAVRYRSAILQSLRKPDRGEAPTEIIEELLKETPEAWSGVAEMFASSNARLRSAMRALEDAKLVSLKQAAKGWAVLDECLDATEEELLSKLSDDDNSVPLNVALPWAQEVLSHGEEEGYVVGSSAVPVWLRPFRPTDDETLYVDALSGLFRAVHTSLESRVLAKRTAGAPHKVSMATRLMLNGNIQP